VILTFWTCWGRRKFDDEGADSAWGGGVILDDGNGCCGTEGVEEVKGSR